MNFRGFWQYLLSVCRNRKDHLKTTFLNKCNPAWVRQPFSYYTTTADISSPYTDDIIELQESEVKNVTSTQHILKGFGANKLKVILLLLKLPLRFSYHSSPLIYESMRFLFQWILKQKSETGFHAKMTENCCFQDKASNFTISHRKTTWLLDACVPLQCTTYLYSQASSQLSFAEWERHSLTVDLWTPFVFCMVF